ncbi:MAG: gamma-glutamylcyclotransferase family protein [Paracoccaceae bacterium]
MQNPRQHPRFFGYGSLVNRSTHIYPDAQRARLEGWRRIWIKTPGRDVVFLSVQPDATCAIDGLTARVPDADWDALDTRETGYIRQIAPQFETETWVYSVPENTHTNDGPHVILRSYLDVVAQGFLIEFGESGVADFFASTDNWHIPILDDRAAPRYSRHQSLSPAETELIDHHINLLSS